MVLRRAKYCYVFTIVSAFLIAYSFVKTYIVSRNYGSVVHSQFNKEMIIAVVSCGQRYLETLTMIKSALLFKNSNENLRFIIFCEKDMLLNFNEKLNSWLSFENFTFELHILNFPENNEIEWKNLFKPCASQRLFLPSLLKTVDSVLYVDTDVLFLSPVKKTWDFFNEFNDTQVAALTSEHEDESVGWYNRFARHPFYGSLGLNSGVMLMNLTRMRAFHWENKVLPIYKKYKLRITWGDQDIINILFYYHPEKVYIIRCEYNYRPDHCMYSNVCNMSKSGINILHGNRGYFHSDKQPLFKLIYNAVENYHLGTSPYFNFYLPLKNQLMSLGSSNCGKVVEYALKSATTLFDNPKII